MVKFAREEKPFDPISDKLLGAIASPPGASLVDIPLSPTVSETARGNAPSGALPVETAGQPVPAPAPVPAEVDRDRPSPPGSRRPPPKPPPPRPDRGERLSRAVKCLFTPTEEEELRALVDRLAEAAGTSLTLSHLMRPYFDLLLHCEEQVDEEFRRAEIVRPPNDKMALAYFERQLAEAIHAALRKAPALRTDHAEPSGEGR